MEKLELKANTILHTKDGRRIGNSIVIGFEKDSIIIKTDYGNICKFLESEINELFFIAFIDYKKEVDGFSTEEAQEYCSNDHKHKV